MKKLILLLCLVCFSCEKPDYTGTVRETPSDRNPIIEDPIPKDTIKDPTEKEPIRSEEETIARLQYEILVYGYKEDKPNHISSTPYLVTLSSYNNHAIKDNPLAYEISKCWTNFLEYQHRDSLMNTIAKYISSPSEYCMILAGYVWVKPPYRWEDRLRYITPYSSERYDMQENYTPLNIACTEATDMYYTKNY